MRPLTPPPNGALWKPWAPPWRRLGHLPRPPRLFLSPACSRDWLLSATSQGPALHPVSFHDGPRALRGPQEA
eukprot:8776933-Pyramimonas_sp.AAC.1